MQIVNTVSSDGSGVASERTVHQRGAAGGVVLHPTTVVGSVVRECAICHRGAAVVVVVHPTAPRPDETLDITIGNCEPFDNSI